MSVPLRALFIEDSEDDTELALRELRHGGYDVQFARVDSPETMTAALRDNRWDIVICDYSMPRFSGMDALKLLRSTGSELPFIFLSGTIGEDTAVAALKLGAQNYLLKSDLQGLLPAVERELKEREERNERAQLQRQVQQLQKFEAVGRLAGGIAHDFNNALGVILGWAQSGYEELPAGDSSREKFHAIVEQAQSAAGLTKQLLALASRQILQPETLNLNECVKKSVRLLGSVMGPGIQSELVLAPNLVPIRGDPTQIDQVLMNVCLNARDAMPHGGLLVIQTQNSELTQGDPLLQNQSKPGTYAVLSISDNGTGMDDHTREHIFEPFFTTKGVARGTGLGLAIVYGIVRQHGGMMRVYSEAGKGTSFHILFPAAMAAPAQAPEVRMIEKARSSETILIAEDHKPLRELAHRMLTSCGYHVIAAKDGGEALQMFENRKHEIDLALLDISMPIMRGPEACSRMRLIRPDLPVIFVTGNASEAASLGGLLERGMLFLQKPYSRSNLNEAIRTMFDRHQKLSR